MDVRTLLNDGPGSEEAEISGWLVIIDDELHLLEEHLSADYKDSMKIKIAERSIIYALCGAVLPLGGGKSFVFHKAKLIGSVCVDPVPELKVRSLYIQEPGQTDMSPVDISKSALEAAKGRYEAALNYDFFKEMGDR